MCVRKRRLGWSAQSYVESRGLRDGLEALKLLALFILVSALACCCRQPRNTSIISHTPYLTLSLSLSFLLLNIIKLTLHHHYRHYPDLTAVGTWSRFVLPHPK